MKGLFSTIPLEDKNGAILAKIDKGKVLELVLNSQKNNVSVSNFGCEGRQPRLETESHTNYDYVFLYDIDKT